MTNCVGIVVLGMGRSGTSAVTRMFARTGFFAGCHDDLMPATQANPTGHWENLRIWRANEQILHRLAGSWFDPPPVAAQVAARDWATSPLRFELDCIIAQAGDAPVAIKDPRIGVMLPLWRPIIAARLQPVLVIRDPVEIASSLARRDGTPPSATIAAWELHMACLLEHLDGQMVTVAPYAHLLAEPYLGPQIVEQAAAQIAPTRRIRVQVSAASEALDPAFHHNRVASGDHDAHLTGRQARLWTYLSSLPAGNQTLDPGDLRLPSRTARSRVRSETERVRVAESLATERARALDLDRQLSLVRGHATTLDARVALERAQADHLLRLLASEEEQNARLSSQLASERDRATAAEAGRLAAEALLARVQNSRSWQITAPLRRLKHALRNRRHIHGRRRR